MMSALFLRGERVTLGKFHIGILSSLIFLFQVSVLYAEPSVDVFKSMQDIEAVPDNYGGYIFFSNDSNGNKSASNNLAWISEGIIFAHAAGNARSGEIVEAGEVETDSISQGSAEEDYFESEYEEYHEGIPDPLEPVNRIFFHFNDKLYFWLLKPVAKGYGAVVPELARVSVRNFFNNLGFPIRFVNCLLQARFESAGNEFSRFMVNSLIGLGGLFDPATKDFGIKGQEEDLGQTLGKYGFGPVLYINWPFLGPSSIRDTFGKAGDSFLDPLGYICSGSECNIAVKGYETINDTSFRIGDYEDLKDAALDPYLAVRDAYFQYRRNKIKE